MTLIHWNDNLSVNVAKIDLQHKKLIALINELNDAMMKGQGRDVAGDIIRGLVSYVDVHFKTEETYFAQFAYPDAESHKKEHEDFVRKVSEFQEGVEKGKLSLSIDIMDFLADWLKNHIKGTDQQYSKFFNDQGLT